MSVEFASLETGLRGQIAAGSITSARIGAFDIAALSPLARAQWDQLGRRFAAMEEFDRLHPRLAKFQGWPLIGSLYARARRDYVLAKEPTLP